MQDLRAFPGQGFQQKKDAGYLQTAAGGARTGTDQHQQYQDHLRECRPQVEVRGGITGGGNDRRDLERCLSDGIRNVIVKVINIKGNIEKNAMSFY